MSRTDEFEEFAFAHAPRLGRVAWLLTGDHHAAEDLVQDTLTKLYVSWGRVARSDDPARYARATMLNIFISGRRNQRARRPRRRPSPELLRRCRTGSRPRRSAPGWT